MKNGSGFGHVAMERSQSKLLLTNYVASRGAQGATNSREAMIRPAEEPLIKLTFLFCASAAKASEGH